MKAQVYVNRHVMAANKKATKDRGLLIDEAAISVNTYLGVVYGKDIEFTQGCKLVQDAARARCSGATIWVEAEFESLVIDGVPANRSMFQRS
jgi:hypothetical protein